MEVVVEAFKLTRLFPRSETFGLSSQVQRAATSVPANIAEGHGREHLGDYLHHLSVANGSLMKLETHVLVAGRLVYPKQADMDSFLAHTAELGRMLAGLIRSLKEKSPGT